MGATLTPQEKSDHFERHFVYECELLFGLPKRIAASRHDLQAGSARDEAAFSRHLDACAHIETFALKARLMIDFIFKPGDHRDVSADSYVRGWSPGQLSQLLDDAWMKASKQGAHLTRRDPATDLARFPIDWDVVGIALELADCVDQFLNALPAGDVPVDSVKAVRYVIAELRASAAPPMAAQAPPDPLMVQLMQRPLPFTTEFGGYRK